MMRIVSCPLPESVFSTVFLLFLIGLIGCVEEHGEVVPADNGVFEVPEGFDFSTTKEIYLDFVMPNTIAFGDYKGRLNVYTEAGGKLLASSSFDDEGTWTGKINVPTSQSILYFSTIAMDTLVELSTIDPARGYVSIDLSDYYEFDEEDTVFNSPKIAETLARFTSSEEILPYILNGDFSENEFGTDNSWLSFNTEEQIWHFAVHGIGKMPMTWYNENGNGFIGTTFEQKAQFGASQTIRANPGDLITFSIDVKAEVSNGMHSRLWAFPRNAGGGFLGRADLRYSYPAYEWTTKSIVMTMPANTSYFTVAVLGGDWTSSGRILYDNASAGDIMDRDGDGIEDDQDDFPDDPEKAYVTYYPNAEDFGTLAFEDNWPGRGDYDFNDLVVDYQFKYIYNADNEITQLDVEYRFRAIGASRDNGFGFQLDIPSSKVASVTGTSLLEGYINTMANGTEAGQSKATIIVADNAFNVLNHPGSGNGVNTTPGTPFVAPESVNLEITFTEPLSIAELGYAPFNPFMIIDQDRGSEVHLPGYEPTDLVDTSLFGTRDDDTQPGSYKYYLTDKNLPWAINLPTSFKYPVEKTNILDTYVHYQRWAQSSGYTFMDWYQDKPGYTHEAHVYAAEE